MIERVGVFMGVSVALLVVLLTERWWWHIP